MNTVAAPPYSRVLHGSADQLAGMRGELRDYLTGCPRADDVVLIASEMAANSVKYSESAGAFLIVRCELFPTYCWTETEDLGGAWYPRQRDGRPHGLTIIEALAEEWGTEVTTDGERVTWARVSVLRPAHRRHRDHHRPAGRPAPRAPQGERAAPRRPAAVAVMTHRGHAIVPHDHSWQRRQWGFTARCSGRWFCWSCQEWFEGEAKCTSIVRQLAS